MWVASVPPGCARLGLAGVIDAKGRARHAAITMPARRRIWSSVTPDALWVADVTYVPTWARFVCIWRLSLMRSMATHLRTELVLWHCGSDVQRRDSPLRGLSGLKESSQHGFVEPIVSDSVKPPQFSNQGPFSVAHSTSQQRHRVLLPKSD